jgi:hypothetical protein
MSYDTAKGGVDGGDPQGSELAESKLTFTKRPRAGEKGLLLEVHLLPTVTGGVNENFAWTTRGLEGVGERRRRR